MDKKQAIENLKSLKSCESADCKMCSTVQVVIDWLQSVKLVPIDSVVLTKEQAQQVWQDLNIYVGDNEDIHDAELQIMAEISDQLLLSKHISDDIRKELNKIARGEK